MKYTFVPLLFGIAMSSLKIWKFFDSFPTLSETSNIMLTGLIIIISVCIVLYYGNKYDVKRIIVWIILAIIFGGWALIAFNLIILNSDYELKLYISRITKVEYKELQIADIFGTESATNKYFAKIANKNAIAKMSWNSDFIYPKIVEIVNNLYCIGADKTFAVFTTNRIVFRVNLNYDFCEAKIWTSKIIIATDLEVIVLNINSYKVENTVKLADPYKGISITEGFVDIRCCNGTNVKQSLA